MLLWILSLVALALAPLLHQLARKAQGALEAIDGFVLAAISGIVLLHIIPHAVESQGWIALAVAAAGLLGPGMTERVLGKLAKPAHSLAMVFAVAGIAVHTFMDGAALGASVGAQGEENARTFAYAVILHRVPEGLMIWWLARPALGARAAAWMLLAVGAATTAGFFGGEALVSGAATRWITLFQALVAGSLLHVVTHRPHPAVQEPPRDKRRPWSGIGALIGLALLLVILGPHAEELRLGPLAKTLLGLSLQVSPLLVIAYVLSGFVYSLLPQPSTAWWRRGSRGVQSLRGVLFGAPLPICSCGALPLYQSLLARGVPPAAALAFLIAAPEIGIDAVLLSIPLLGPSLTIARLACALLVALFAAWAVSLGVGKTQGSEPHSHSHDEPATSGERIARGLRFGLRDMVDETGPWIVLGLVLASAGALFIDPTWLNRLPPGLDVPVLALVGMPVYVCASGATPLLAVLVAKGISPGAAIAFLLTGPATNLTTFGVLARLHGVRVATAFAAVVGGLAIALGFAVNALLPKSPLPSLWGDDLLHPSLVSYAFLGLFCSLLFVSLLRQGPRGFVGQLVSLWPHRHVHDDECGDCCEHEHGEHDPCADRHEHSHAHSQAEDHEHRSASSHDHHHE